MFSRSVFLFGLEKGGFHRRVEVIPKPQKPETAKLHPQGPSRSDAGLPLACSSGYRGLGLGLRVLGLGFRVLFNVCRYLHTLKPSQVSPNISNPFTRVPQKRKPDKLGRLYFEASRFSSGIRIIRHSFCLWACRVWRSGTEQGVCSLDVRSSEL